MAIKKTSDNRWRVELYPEGRNGKRVRKLFSTKAEATRFESFVMSKSTQGEAWNPRPDDNRRFSELIGIWYDQHGKHLNDGERRKRKLKATGEAMGNPIARQLTAATYLKYRAQCKTKPKTQNNELGYLNAVYNNLRESKQIDYENPLAGVKPIKIKETELAFLTLPEINELLATIKATADNPHVLLITKICLATGCRWGEAEKLHRRHVVNKKVTFTDTKSGKNRTVPITPELEKEIVGHGKGKLFTSSIGAFRRALAKTSIELPKGQASHVLRHTFASHFMINKGNILTLQKILGHSTILMTMRYAHLAPDHLSDAVKLNPLNYAATLPPPE